MLSLGLLDDQPRGPGTPPVAERLTTLVRQRHGERGVAPAALHARALLVGSTLTEVERELLHGMVAEGRIGKTTVPHRTRAYAAHALGRLGGAEDVAPLLRLVTITRRVPYNLQRSAAIALGRLAARLPAADRAKVAGKVAGRIGRTRDVTTRHFLIMALVPLLEAGPSRETAVLLDIASRGKYLDRPYGALALGLLLRRVDPAPTDRKPAAFHTKALVTLRRGLCDRRLGPEQRAAFALALGLARDAAAMPMLRTMARDERRDARVRGYALLALAYGAPGESTHRFAREQALRRPSGFLSVAATRVLGLTADHADASTVALLARGVRMEEPGMPCGEAAVALARVGTVEACDVLLAVARDPSRPELARCMAFAGLGRIGDPERAPSLCLITEGLNYRASTDLVSEVLSYL